MMSFKVLTVIVRELTTWKVTYLVRYKHEGPKYELRGYASTYLR